MAPQPKTSRRDVLEAQALLSGLTELAGRAGHDLVGPLNQAGSLLSLFIRRHKNQGDSEADQLLEFLQTASARMERLVAGLGKYMEIAGRTPSFEPVDLNTSLAACLASLDKLISESAAMIESESLPVASADAAQMVTVFESLIGNSIEFRKPGRPPRIRISAKRANGIAAIAISDNGIGIDPEHHETVFLPFRRLNGKEYPGTGLGLAMAKLIVERHGGNIGIAPALQALQAQGSSGTCVRFTVRLG